MQVWAATYPRLYADSEGESHFERGDIEVAEANFAPPAPPLAVSEPIAATRIVFTRLRAGWFGDFRPTPRRQWFFTLAGKLEVQASDGETLSMEPGDMVLLEDKTGKGHRTRVMGEEDMFGVFVKLQEQ